MEYIKEIFNLLASNQFLSGGLFLGLLASIFYPLKTLPYTLWSKIKFYFTYKIYLDQSDEVYNVFSRWFEEKYPDKFRNIEVKFKRVKTTLYGDTLNQKDWKLWKYQYIDSNFIFYHNRLIWISKNRKELESAKDLFSMHLNSYSISGIMAKKAIDLLLEELVDKKIQEEGGQIISTYIINRDSFAITNTNSIKDFKNIFFKGKNEYLKRLDEFVSKESFFKSKNITYKTSFLLHGRGGTGKSSTACATAKYLNYDLYLMNLASIEGDSALINLVAQIPPKSVILFEDMDCYFKNRDEINSSSSQSSINFSTVLNVFDGVYSPNDCIFIMTTNKLENLDDALLRKGRVDEIIHIDYPRIEDVKDFVNNFYEEETPIRINKFDNSMSEVQEILLHNTKEEAIEKLELLSNSKSFTKVA